MSELITLVNNGRVDVDLTFNDQSDISIVLPLNPTVSVALTFSGSILDAGGGAMAPLSAVANEDISAGFPVAISRANGKILKAVASYKPSAFVAGLLITDVAMGFVGSFSPSRLMLTDWSAVTGSVNLLPGRTYFLGNNGGLDFNPPGVGSCAVVIGMAVDGNTLLVDIQPPIQL